MEESIRAVLPGCFLFAGVPEGEAMAALSGCGSIRRCERGEVILSPQQFTPMLEMCIRDRPSRPHRRSSPPAPAGS